jgi:hypothetical protein
MDFGKLNLVKIGYGSSSQFSVLTQLPQKMAIASKSGQK